MNKLIMMIGAAVAAACVTMPALADTVSYWDFSSDPAGEFDRTGRNDLENNGGVTIEEGAAVFDGMARQLITGSEVKLRNDQPYTFECFAQVAPDCDGMIMEVSPNNGDTVGGFYLYAAEGVMARTAEWGYNGESFNGSIRDGQWHHLAVIIDPTTDVVTDSVQLYVDGVRQGVRSNNGGIAYLSPHRFCIGSRNGTSFPFKGKIDDVRITEGILDPSEFLQVRSSESLDVRAYYKFDSEDPLADSSGNDNTLQCSQGVAFTDGCASFDGTASDVRTVNTLDLSAYKDVTVECFVRKHAGMPSSGMIAELTQSGWNSPGGFYMTVNGNDDDPGKVSGVFCFASGSNYRCGVSPAYAANAGWHHVALVKDSSNVGNASCISLYVDGVRVTAYWGEGEVSGNFLANDYLYIGSRANGSIFLDGDVDDVRITANVLQPWQFLRTRTGSLDDVIAYWPFKSGKMLVDATGNGNVLTGNGVAASGDGAAVFDGSQSGFATLAPLPLYLYKSMTVEWFMQTSMSDVGMVLETTPLATSNPGAFYAAVNEAVGYQLTSTYNLAYGWALADGGWHHYALVYDWDATTADVVRLYRDGVQIPHSGNALAAKLLTGTLFIGTRGGSTLSFVGQLDDIKITGRALDPSEFMTERSVPPGMVISVR